jgi:hypothetical protein
MRCNLVRRITNKKLWVLIGILAVAIVGLIFVSQVGITPTDTKIIDLLHANEENLLGIVGMVGAGIARDETNHIIGIAVYIEANLTDSQQVPSKLGEFTVYVKDVAEASEYELENMIIRNSHYHFLAVTTDKTLYRQNDTVTITIKNESNETFTFGNSAYDLYFEKWNGTSWEFYTGVIGLDVITPLNPTETAQIDYMLGGQIDKPFPSGKYRVISRRMGGSKRTEHSHLELRRLHS